MATAPLDTATSSAAAAPPAMAAPAPARPEAPRVVRGSCWALFAYDVGQSIDLERAGRQIREFQQREVIRHKRRAPQSFEYTPAPLRVTQAAASLSIGGFQTAPAVECVLFDFGAVSVSYTLPLGGPLEGLLELSDLLYENPALLEDSQRRVHQLVRAIGPAVSRPAVSPFVEDYVIYEIAEMDPHLPAPEAVRALAPLLARILRAETGPLAPEEITEAMAARIAYGPDDAAVIDWNAAILLERDAEDVRAVLEFANVELLEMRYLDDQLDRALDRAHRALPAPSWRDRLRVFSDDAAGLRRIASLQVDSALLFENVNNALKVMGDHYLARVYRLAANRLGLPDWDASILRKLQTVESIYTKIANRQANRRIEVLEWIIILLIAFEIVWAFVA